MLLYLKTFGVKITIEKVLENPSENDWKALNKLDSQLNKLQLHVLRKEFLIALMPQNEFKTKDALGLGIDAIAIFDKEEAINYLNKVDTKASFIVEDADLLSKLGNCEKKFGNFDKALEYYEKCLAIRLKTMGGEHPSVATSYNNIGLTWINKGETDKALEYYTKSLAIRLKTLGGEHPSVATSYFNIGNCNYELKSYLLAIDFFKKGFSILKKGGFPFQIGKCYEALDNKDLALNYFIQSAEIRRNDTKPGMENESTKKSIESAKRLAKELGKENELPDWMKGE